MVTCFKIFDICCDAAHHTGSSATAELLVKGHSPGDSSIANL